MHSLDALLRMWFARAPSPEDFYLMLGFNVTVPPYVPQALFSRAFDNDDLLPRIEKPVLIVHGAEDAVVKPSIVEQHMAAMPGARVCVMPDVGHAPFWDDAQSFNEQSRSFCATL